MTASECHEIAKRERRIAQLEREVARLGDIITAQADRLALVQSWTAEVRRNDGGASLIGEWARSVPE